MTRRKQPARPEATLLPPVDPERDDANHGRTINRKQLLEMNRRKQKFDDADFRGCDLSGIAFDGLDLTNAKFAESNLSKCSFRGANLTGASFFGASLKDASLEEALLEETDFDYAWLDGVTFRGAKIRKAVFPLKRLSLDTIRESVRTGKRVAMEPFALDDEEP